MLNASLLLPPTLPPPQTNSSVKSSNSTVNGSGAPLSTSLSSYLDDVTTQTESTTNLIQGKTLDQFNKTKLLTFTEHVNSTENSTGTDTFTNLSGYNYSLSSDSYETSTSSLDSAFENSYSTSFLDNDVEITTQANSDLTYSDESENLFSESLTTLANTEFNAENTTPTYDRSDSDITTSDSWSIASTASDITTKLVESVTDYYTYIHDSLASNLSITPTDSIVRSNATDRNENERFSLWNASAVIPTIIEPLSNFTNNVSHFMNGSDLSDDINYKRVYDLTHRNTSDSLITQQHHRAVTHYVISLQYYLGEMIVVVILLGILTFWNMFGNLLVLIALGKFKYLKTMSNYLIGNLAVCDFLLALTVLPLSLANDVLGHWVFGEVICNIWLSIDVLYCTASIWSLCVIALDRFTATSFPVWYREKRSVKRATIYISLVWVFSIIVTVPPLFGWQDRSKNFQFDNTTQTYQCILFQNIEYVIYSSMGSFIIPLFLMVLLYVKIFIVIRKRSKQMHRAYMKQKNRGGSKKLTNVQTANQKATPPQNIELNTIPKVGNTKKDDSKLLFSYSTESSPDKSDDEDDLSSEIATNSPGYYSEKETRTTLLRRDLRNGMVSTTEATDSDTLVITNPSSKMTAETDKESQSDQEKVKLMKKIKIPNIKNSKSDQNKNNHLVNEHEGGTTTEDDEGKKKKPQLPIVKQSNPFKRDRLRSSFRKFDKREQRATKRMGMIISCFFICWMPFTIMYLTRSLCDYCEKLNPNLLAFIIWLGYANSGLNPLLYTIFNEDFRKAFYRMLCGCFIKPKNKAMIIK